jgi:hypothetical protein
MSAPTIAFESTTDTYRGGSFKQFRVGTCDGLWRTTDDAYEILAVLNRQKGNGHFKQAMLWFEQSCRRDGKKFRILEVWNVRLAFMLRRNGFKWNTLFTWEKSF